MPGDPADRVIDELFSSLDETLPGSKKTRRETRPDLVEKANVARHGVTTASSDDDEIQDRPPWWDYSVEIGGRTFFTASAIAVALNRSVNTVRRWESQGVIPKTLYRRQRAASPRVSKNSVRLYTEAHVVGLRQIAIDVGLFDLQPGSKIPPEFPERAKRLFALIKQKEKQS